MTSSRAALFKKLASALAAVVVAVGLYTYGIERNRGFVPAWFDRLFSEAWGVFVLAGALILLRSIERGFLGEVKPEKFRLSNGERALFAGNFMSFAVYPDARTFNAEGGRKNWIQPYTGLLGLGRSPSDWHLSASNLFWIRLTDRRLAFGILPSRTWRSVPLADIVGVREVHGRWPYRNVSLVEYLFDGRREAIVLSNRFRRSREFTHRLAAAIHR